MTLTEMETKAAEVLTHRGFRKVNTFEWSDGTVTGRIAYVPSNPFDKSCITAKDFDYGRAFLQLRNEYHAAHGSEIALVSR